MFQNLGDGTYFHSGLLAIRACVAAEVNITYKILYNDAVPMTGGQPVDGPLSPMSISRQVAAEGVKRIVVVSDEPDKYGAGADFAPGASFEHRRELDRVQRELRDIPGVTVLIYDQTCAAEKRRRRKRGAMIDPPRRIFINDAVCEGCGDCSRTSNCLSVLPLETPLGRKRMIDQSSCNKDYSCAEGFCPSFVNVIGAVPRKSGGGRAVPRTLSLLPEPSLAKLPDDRPYSLLVTGIGGTGVVTIAALLTMAAHMEGKAFSTIDQFGMAQKGGAVTSHVRIAADEGLLGARRLGVGSADLLLGCDSLVTGGELALAVIDPDRTRVVVNSRQSIIGHFALDPDLQFPEADLYGRIREEADPGRLDVLDATRLATALLGDSIATNLFMLGFAYQKGAIPIGAAAIGRAIELNGLAIEMNKQAFLWGRRAAHDLAAVEALLDGPAPAPETLDEIVAHRRADLVGYQDEAHAARYEALVRRVAAREGEQLGAPGPLSLAVARNLHKLMAYKDEYEVARLVNGGAKRDHRGGVRRDHLAAAGLSPSPWEGPGCDAACPQQADAAARAGGTCGPTGSSVGWVVGSVRRRGLTPAALVEPVALAIHLEDVDVVGEAVEESAGEALGAEHLGPFVEGQIGGDQGRAPLVALAEHLEQQLGAGLRQRHEAEFVDDQKLAGGELLLEPQQLLVIAGLDELVDQCGGGDEADREALLAGRQAETEGDVGLAGAAVAERDEVLAALDVLAAGQLQDQRLVERGDDLEVEAVEALDHGEARRLDAPLDHAALAVDQLELDESQQVADVIDAFRGALPGDLVVLAQEGRQLQRLEVVGEQHLRCVGHAPSPDSRLMYDLADVIATRARGRYG